MMRGIGLMVFLGMLLLRTADAARNVSAGDRIVGSTFKTMAKAYIAASDIETLKQKNIERIRTMRDDWFEKQYDEVYAVIRDLPPGVRQKHRIVPAMTKDEVIRVIRSLHKKQIYEIIDAVPDQAIAGQFNEQMRKGGFEGKDLMMRISMIWDRIVGAVQSPSAR